jgi:hypothetical protein
MTPALQPEFVEIKRYTMAELYEMRRVIIMHSRTIPPGAERNQHRQIATSIRRLFRNKAWLATHTVDGLL